MNAWSDVVTRCAGIAAGNCAGLVVNEILRTVFKDAKLTKMQRVAWICGMTVIGEFVARKCGDYVEEELNDWVNLYQTIKEGIKKSKVKGEDLQEEIEVEAV